MRGYSIGTWRNRHKRRGWGSQEYRVHKDEQLVAVCPTAEKARLVYQALLAYYQTPSTPQEEPVRRSMSGDEMWRDNNA